MLPLFAAAVAAVTSPVPSASPSPIPQIVRVVTSDRSEEALSKATRVTYVVTKQQINKMDTVRSATHSRKCRASSSRVTAPSDPISPSAFAAAIARKCWYSVNGMPAPGSFANSVNLGTFSTAGIDRSRSLKAAARRYMDRRRRRHHQHRHRPSTQANGMVRYGSFGDSEVQAGGAGFTVDRT